MGGWVRVRPSIILIYNHSLYNITCMYMCLMYEWPCITCIIIHIIHGMYYYTYNTWHVLSYMKYCYAQCCMYTCTYMFVNCSSNLVRLIARGHLCPHYTNETASS